MRLGQVVVPRARRLVVEDDGLVVQPVHAARSGAGARLRERPRLARLKIDNPYDLVVVLVELAVAISVDRNTSHRQLLAVRRRGHVPHRLVVHEREAMVLERLDVHREHLGLPVLARWRLRRQVTDGREQQVVQGQDGRP